MPVLLMMTERFAPDLGGVARSAARTAASISRLGWQVHVLAWTKTLPPGALDSDEMDGVTVHRLGLFSNLDLSMQHTSNVLEWLHGEHCFDAVWGHYVYPAGYMAVVFAEMAGIPSTVSARGNDIDRLMFPPGDFARLMWTLQRATAISSVSEDLASKIQMLLGAPCQTVVVPNAVDADVFEAVEDATVEDATRNSKATSLLRSKLGISENEAVLGFCGELRHKKGLPFLLAALAEVRQHRSACLLVIGAVRPREQAHLSTFAIEHPESASRIIVTGHLDSPDEVARHLRLCDVVLQPSVWDGMPNAVLEAMSCGRIVIASDAGGIPELVDHNVNGFLVPKALLHQLGVAVEEVLQLPRDRKLELQRQARQTIIDHFQADTEAIQLKKVLGYLLSRKQ